MNIKIDKLQSLHILTDVVDYDDLGGLQDGTEERTFANYFPSGVSPFGYETTRPYREFMSFTIDGHHHYERPIDRFDVTFTREDESNHHFSVRIIMPFNDDTLDAILALSDSVRLGLYTSRTTFYVVIRRYDSAGVSVSSAHIRGCDITSLETREGHKAELTIDAQTVFYV